MINCATPFARSARRCAERFLDRCSFSQARRWRSMRRRWLGGRSDSTPRKNGASARVQRPAAAEMIRASVKNRVDSGVPGASVANHGRRRSERSRAVLLTVACRGANSRSASVHRRPFDQGWRCIGRACETATCSRRDGTLRTKAKRSNCWKTADRTPDRRAVAVHLAPSLHRPLGPYLPIAAGSSRDSSCCPDRAPA